MIADVLSKKEILVRSSIEEVHRISEKVLAFFSSLKLSESNLFDIRLCFEEALINAIKYGSRENSKKMVKVEVAYNAKTLFMAVEDEGEGFDPNVLSDPTEDGNLELFRGRGVYLIKSLMTHVQFNAKGNRVEMTKNYQT